MQRTMKPLIWIMTGLLLMLALAACQPAGTATPGVGEAPENYPAPQQESAVVVQVNVLYPDTASGSEVSWPQAYGMLMNGEVSQVMQAKAEKITLMLKDGRSLVALQPAAGDILRAIENCGEPCAAIQVSE